MRHINQMTLEELEAAIAKVSQDKLGLINTNFVKYKQLDAFEDRLKQEGRERAKTAGIANLAEEEYGVIGL